ncbi:hypothetical protein HY629_03135 [Candidatus Uhrbacteria bacterium]|nr:hypothetical protein [Candidatus Uhrbacteria bacterium]
MKGDKLFQKYYEPKLIAEGIDNIVLRTYTHIKGLATDDPDNSTALIFTPRREVDERLDAIFERSGQDCGMAVTSIVSVKTEQKYLFLLDCTLTVSEEHERELIDGVYGAMDHLPALRRGMLLRTIHSYHLIGFTPLDKEEWQQHMAQALLLHSSKREAIGDARYIGHSLERGYGSLRISDYQNKPTPDFICYFT